MLISCRIILPQNPDLHREQRHQPTKKVLRDTEETKGDFILPRFPNKSELWRASKARFASRSRHLIRRRVRYAHVSCFYFPTHPHQNTIGSPIMMDTMDETGYDGFALPWNEENLELVTVSKTDKRINGIVTTETNEKT